MRLGGCSMQPKADNVPVCILNICLRLLAMPLTKMADNTIFHSVLVST